MQPQSHQNLGNWTPGIHLFVLRVQCLQEVRHTRGGRLRWKSDQETVHFQQTDFKLEVERFLVIWEGSLNCPCNSGVLVSWIFKVSINLLFSNQGLL